MLRRRRVVRLWNYLASSVRACGVMDLTLSGRRLCAVARGRWGRFIRGGVSDWTVASLGRGFVRGRGSVWV